MLPGIASVVSGHQLDIVIISVIPAKAGIQKKSWIQDRFRNDNECKLVCETLHQAEYRVSPDSTLKFQGICPRHPGKRGNLPALIQLSLTGPGRSEVERVERETGFEPATSYLEGRHSATELLPHVLKGTIYGELF